MVVDRDCVHIHVYPAGLFDVSHRLLDYGECFQPKEVHFDKSGFLNDASFILRHYYLLLGVGGLIYGGAHRYPVGNLVAADDYAAGMHTGISYCPLKSLGIF